MACHTYAIGSQLVWFLGLAKQQSFSATFCTLYALGSLDISALGSNTPVPSNHGVWVDWTS